MEKAISENKIKPILSCVYMETRGEMLFLCGTNLETTITTTVSCKEVVKEGKVAFQYPLIDEYMKELKEEEIQIRMDGEALMVEGEMQYPSSQPFLMRTIRKHLRILKSRKRKFYCG